jgi:hypothetical protein
MTGMYRLCCSAQSSTRSLQYCHFRIFENAERETAFQMIAHTVYPENRFHRAYAANILQRSVWKTNTILVKEGAPYGTQMDLQ